MRYGIWLALGLATGCGSGGGNQPPFAELYPAKGVLVRDGQPVKGGVLQLAAIPPSAEFLINAEVGSDGAFELTTVRATDSRGERKSGVAAGTYTATYRPPVADQMTGNLNPVALPKPVVVEAKPNDWKLELAKK